MELNFTLENGLYVATFTATTNFNIHIERESRGLLGILQTSVENSQYSPIIDHKSLQDKIFDCDFSGVIWPKYIKIISDTEIVKCIITM